MTGWRTLALHLLGPGNRHCRAALGASPRTPGRSRVMSRRGDPAGSTGRLTGRMGSGCIWG